MFWTANAANPREQITQETLLNGVVSNRAFDAVTGWTKTIQSGVGGGTGVQNLEYAWDKLGNLSSRKDKNQSSLTETFTYDNLYRMNAATLSTGPNTTIGYDALGNITSKSDVGSYTYHATKKHQVMSTGSPTSWSFGYDANGNMTSGRGATFTWTSYNYPASITNGADTAAFSYTPDRQYWKQVSNYASGGAATTLYIGGLLEKVTTSTGSDYRHYIRAGGSTVIVSRQSTGTNSFYYVTSDHLGSSSAITNSAGGILVNSSFDAFGKRRGANWTGNPSAGDWSAIASTTRRGFTEHTMLDNLNLTHMNGRVYDQWLGRFASSDPYIPSPSITQSFNRYSYVRNSPLSLIDPSGFMETITVAASRPVDQSTIPRWTDSMSGWDVSALDTPGEIERSEEEVLEEIVVTGERQKKGDCGFNFAGSMGLAIQIGASPLGASLGGSGSVGGGLSVNPSDWLDSRFFAQGQVAAFSGIGTFVGVGGQVQGSSGSVAGGWSSQNSYHVEGNFGLSAPGIPGPAFGVSYDQSPDSTGVAGSGSIKSGGGKFGWGAGAAAGAGSSSTLSYGFGTLREILDPNSHIVQIINSLPTFGECKR